MLGAIPNRPEAGWRTDARGSGHKISAVFWEKEQSPHCVIYVTQEVVAGLLFLPRTLHTI